MVNVAICDDEQVEIEFLSNHVCVWAAGRDIQVRISTYESAESLLFAYEDDKAIDILLLDIQMGGMDGVSLAKKIREGNKEVQIIFVTGYMEYVVDGYDVEALHYLLKPVTNEKLTKILDRAITKLAKNERALFISHSGENTRIPLYEIQYLEVLNNYVTIHANEKYMVKKTLTELEKELDDNFFRTGRSYIINLKYIKKTVKKEAYMSNGAVIPLSRGLYELLNKAIIERL